MLDEATEGLAQLESTPDQIVYGMADGSMLLTHDGWQEVKVGRVFTATAISDSEPAKWQMDASQYLAQRGHYRGFTTRFEQLLPPDSACQKVLISDGALWLGQWWREKYPDAIHILDFYHVSEKLALAAQTTCDAKAWHSQQCERLLKGKFTKVVKAIKKLKHLASPDKEKLLHYLKSNRYRMQYDQYRAQRLMISSGPIESAHRTLLQVRMKRSGQRWSDKGADNMIRLRSAVKSDKFHLIAELFKQKAT